LRKTSVLSINPTKAEQVPPKELNINYSSLMNTSTIHESLYKNLPDQLRKRKQPDFKVATKILSKAIKPIIPRELVILSRMKAVNYHHKHMESSYLKQFD
jgi:hypothetical protein